MVGSLIVDWAFATAVGAAGKEIDSFVAMREALRRAEAREGDLAEVLLDAERQGRWARIYLAADLCGVIRGPACDTRATVAKRMLLDLLDGEEGNVARNVD